MSLRKWVFVIGPHASAKSNVLDVLRFLRDIAKPGGGLERAVAERIVAAAKPGRCNAMPPVHTGGVEKIRAQMPK